MIDISEEEYQFPSGAVLTMRFNKSILHSGELPAITLTTPDGLSLHMHFNNGKLESGHPQTLEVSETAGAGIAVHFRDGCRVQAGFPASNTAPKRIG